MKIVKCGMKECHVRLSRGSIQGKQYCSKEHRTINEMRESQAELKEYTKELELDIRNLVFSYEKELDGIQPLMSVRNCIDAVLVTLEKGDG